MISVLTLNYARQLLSPTIIPLRQAGGSKIIGYAALSELIFDSDRAVTLSHAILNLRF